MVVRKRGRRRFWNIPARQLLVIILPLLTFSLCPGLYSDNTNLNRVCFKKECFEVELAITPSQRIQGLKFRKQLGKNKGMLFLFEEEGHYSFWMKDTLLTLDIIWISKNGKVLFIKKSAEPCKKNSCYPIYPRKKAKYVLEVEGGTVENIGLKVGDVLDFYINK
jgi:uncharacterized membrane protein (UPF0127 family)